MASVEGTTTGGAQMEEITGPMNFSDLTPSKFGISVQSFTPVSDGKDKSRLAQIKARRRSSVGVRGSPETNSLIRFIAQQRMKTPKTPRIPEHVRNSPFPPWAASSLRQKMASFQTLMDLEESEACDPVPRQDSNPGGCIKTRDYLTEGNSCGGGKENLPLPMTPTPSKRRRLGPPESCKLEIRDPNTPSSQGLEKDEKPVSRRPPPDAVLVSPSKQQALTPTKRQQAGACEAQSSSQSHPAVASSVTAESHFLVPAPPSALEMKTTGDEGSAVKPSSPKSRKKSVRFGLPLSPEFFDKDQPPSTPLRKGGTPARAPTPGGALQLRPVLKTPQRNDSQSSQSSHSSQTPPELSSPSLWASPVFSLPRCSRGQSVGEDTEEMSGKIAFPSMDQTDSPVTNAAEVVCSEDDHVTASSNDCVKELTLLSEQQEELEAPVESPSTPQSANCREKTEESEPARRVTRSAATLACGRRTDAVFDVQSSSQSPPDHLSAAASPDQPDSSSNTQPDTQPTGDEGSAVKPSSPKSRKKSVRFGLPLSPEFFDKNQPPSTPLRKGGTPARAPTPGGALQLRPVLKTPQRSDSQSSHSSHSSQTPPELSSPSLWASPVFSLPRCSRGQSVGEDTEEMSGKIAFPSLKEMDSPETRDAECKLDVQPLDLNTALMECQSPAVTDDEPSTTPHIEAPDESTSPPEQQQQPEAVQVQAPAPAPAPSRKRKTKLCVPEQPEESEPAKRSTRSAAKSACGKMTKTVRATRRWNKDVDRSLYGSRAYASKNPTLSPITETFISLSPAAPHTPALTHSTDDCPPEDETVMNTLGNPSEDSLSSSSSRKESRPARGRRPLGMRRGRKRKASLLDDISACEEPAAQPGEKTEEQTTTELEASGETLVSHSTTESGQRSEAEALSHTSNDELCSDMKSEAPTSACVPSGEESSSVTALLSEPVEKKRGKRGRRSSVQTAVLQELCEVPEMEEERAKKENSSSAEQRLESGLAPWQAEFSFEDVFKPVAPRGRRSVRRSLRNQSTAEQEGEGLAWLPQDPPDNRTERRRSSRRSSSAQSVHPSGF